MQNNPRHAFFPSSAPHERVQDDGEEDEGLLARINRGDGAAFAALVRKHADRFYRVAYRFTGNRGDAEDRVQEAFLKLWERPHLWQPDKNATFTTWFHRVIINQCLDAKKKRRALPLLDDSWIEDERDSQEQVMGDYQLQKLLEKEIAALPDRQRTALNLCFYEELSNQEAANIMGLKLKALQSLLMRAKTTLKERLGGTGHAA